MHWDERWSVSLRHLGNGTGSYEDISSICWNTLQSRDTRFKIRSVKKAARNLPKTKKSVPLPAVKTRRHRSDVVYEPGIHGSPESVVSSHFMNTLAQDRGRILYDQRTLQSKALFLTDEQLNQRVLLPLFHASDAFAFNRAHAALKRANLRPHGPLSIDQAVAAIVEVLFDRQLRGTRRESCDRATIAANIGDRIKKSLPINMVIVALPHKLDCPLKSYKGLPDLAEIDFLLSLREIARAVDFVLSRLAAPNLNRLRAHFTIVSDGDRFQLITGTSQHKIEAYRTGLLEWITRLHLTETITITPYNKLLKTHLPAEVLAEKDRLRQAAVRQYGGVMWPLFDPNAWSNTLDLAAGADPDREPGNPQGRFVSLVKSLMFTINYQSLSDLPKCDADLHDRRYRMLVARLSDRYGFLAELEDLGIPAQAAAVLRDNMLRDVWTAAIEYMAEIKSDRELAQDPILSCLPGYLRWTIHAKAGQFGLRVACAMGKRVVPWAGIGYIRKTGTAKLTVCTMPRLAAESDRAIPLFINGLPGQPFCYVDAAIGADTVEDFLQVFATSIARRGKR